MLDVSPVEEPQNHSRRAAIWGAAFFIGMFGTGILARMFDLSSGWSMAVMMPPMLLLIPLVRAGERAQAANCAASAASRQYNRRILALSFVYMATLFLAIWATKAYHPSGLIAWVLAIMPAIPILGMFWAIARYLSDQQDEYLRAQMVQQALIASGFTLAITTVYGFLETFDLVFHLPAYVTAILWFMGLGIGACWNWRQGQ